MAAFTSFILIGERINTHRERFRSAVSARDTKMVVREVRRQLQNGASHLDINAGGGGVSPDQEIADILWILDTALPELPDSAGLSIDSSNPDCQAAALNKLGGRRGTMLNSLSAENPKIESMLALAAKAEAGAAVILANSAGISGLTPNRLKRAEELRNLMLAAGIPDERQFFDPQILPLAFDPLLPRTILGTVRELRSRWPNTHTLVGLSNVSFNMPRRKLLNSVYLAMLLDAGIDSVIADPCCKQLVDTLRAAQALLGQDEFLAGYLSEFKPED
jgi:5-methyltetrahydrofolate--homocysteine methyltransferase